MTTESQTAAAQNGCTMENIIKQLYPGAKLEYTGLIDATINGVRVEIKSCQEHVRDSNNSGGTRSGRFVFNEEQHKALIENNGEYIFLVHTAGVPFLFFRVPARNVPLPEFTGVKSLCWKSIITGAIA
ncbi:hypothetical protein MSKOL_1632 [Methanosarcina sp. Kolksee]|uniref:hypothetical protein n=1 Tax=Methanosarcina sp. Kolksee TaxID=1434099 RepID=UPI000615886E|nr:hypothetical protein [Methanosarcina sp. Kolksee]AKB47409.1 hypothetical protein MSKOL_1632 [Methanosarcina sp. Kolksee]